MRTVRLAPPLPGEAPSSSQRERGSRRRTTSPQAIANHISARGVKQRLHRRHNALGRPPQARRRQEGAQGARVQLGGQRHRALVAQGEIKAMRN